MKWRIFRSEVDPHEEFHEQVASARTPYAEEWKEFDKLQANAKGRGAKWVHFILSNIFVMFGGGAYGLAVFKKHYSYVVATFFGLIILLGLKVRLDHRKYAVWPCPRCHSIWPGTKTEKDSACKVCGLRLHQMAP